MKASAVEPSRKRCESVTLEEEAGEHISYFSMDGDHEYCNDVCGLMEDLQLQHAPDQWRFFIDSSKLSLKVVLLHNVNNLPLMSLSHAGHIELTYATIQGLLEKISYEDHQWNICADLKVVALLTGLQGGYTKLCCFLCEWDSRVRNRHYHYHVKQ
jgi:hypothetical protein